MKHSLKVAGISLALCCASVVGATAATIDFTAYPVGAVSPVGRTDTITVGGDVITWTLTSDPSGQINYNQAYDGPTPSPASAAGLALVNDGVGVRDDELTTSVKESIVETLVLTFDKAVKVTGFHFLDMFKPKNLADGNAAIDFNSDQVEKAGVSWAGGNIFFAAKEDDGVNGGYLFGDPNAPDSGAGVTIYTTQLIFRAGPGNDGLGYADFSLAAVELAPIPVPAGGILLLTALGGLGLARRRKNC